MATPQKIPAIVLAAGLSSRMKAFKPLLLLNGKPLLHHVVDSLRQSQSIDTVYVVTGHQREQIDASLLEYLKPKTQDSSLKTLFNPQYATGEMLSSLKIGIAALPADASAFLLAFADQPAVRAETIQALVVAFSQPPAELVADAIPYPLSPTPSLVLPTFLAKRGHPLVLSTTLVPAIQALGPGESLRTVVHQHLIQATLVPVDDPSVLEDLDTPEDFLRAQLAVAPRP